MFNKTALFEELERLHKGIVVTCVVVTGSRCWQGSNCKDTDLVVVAKNVSIDFCITRSIACAADVFLYSETYFKEMATGGIFNYSPIVGLAKLNPSNILYGELPIENYDWFDYQKPALLQSYEQGLRGYFNFDRLKRITKGYCHKQMTWALLAWYAIKNQSFDFTAEQRETLQKCHDLQLPISYAEELKTNIESKLKEWGLLDN